MKKILTFLSLFLLGSFLAFAQNTTVTATVVDSDSTVWANAAWTLSFQVNTSYPNPSSYTIGGSPLSQTVINQTGTANGSGVLSFTTYQSGAISPAGSSWNLLICPQARVACTTFNFQTIGTTQNISSALNAFIPAPRFSAISGSYGYADVEAVITVPIGGTYWNVTSATQRCYSGIAWQTCNSSSGGGYPGITSNGTGGFQGYSGSGSPNPAWKITGAGTLTIPVDNFQVVGLGSQTGNDPNAFLDYEFAPNTPYTLSLPLIGNFLIVQPGLSFTAPTGTAIISDFIVAQTQAGDTNPYGSLGAITGMVSISGTNPYSVGDGSEYLGVSGIVINDSATNPFEQKGLNGWANNQGSGTVANNFAIYADSPAHDGNTGVITNGFGLYVRDQGETVNIDDQTFIPPVNPWDIWADGTETPSWVSGHLGIGDPAVSSLIRFYQPNLMMVSEYPVDVMFGEQDTTSSNYWDACRNYLGIVPSPIEVGSDVYYTCGEGTIADDGTDTDSDYYIGSNGNQHTVEIDNSGNVGIGGAGMSGGDDPDNADLYVEAGTGATEKYYFAAPLMFSGTSPTKTMDRCNGGTSDGLYVAAGSTAATTCTSGGGSLVDTGIRTP